MSESLANYKVSHDKQIVMLGVERVVGVQSIQATQNFGLSPLSYAGIGVDTVKYIPRQEQSATLNINSYLINKDYFLQLVTGNNLSNMYLMREKNDFNTCYNLISGYFTDFSCSYNIGAVPEINTNVTFLRDAGKIGTGSLPSDAVNQLITISSSNIEPTGSLLIPFGNNISLGIDTFNTNRLQSFTISATSNKVQVYNMGSKFPKKIELIYPINIDASFSFEVGDYDLPRLRSLPQSGIIKNLNLTIGDYSTNATVCNYSFNNMNLVSENYGATINGFVTVQQSYQTKIYG
jgi:hypothetical protein